MEIEEERIGRGKHLKAGYWYGRATMIQAYTQQKFDGVVRKRVVEEERVRKGLSLKFYKDVYASDGNVDELCSYFSRWSDTPLYLVLYNKEKKRYVSVEVPKRGNRLYSNRLLKKFLMMKDNCSLITGYGNKKISVGKKFTSCVFFTLTYKHQCEGNWKRMSKDFNHFMVKLRRAYGEVSCIRVWEAHKSGFPHVHGILFFHTKRFKVFPHKDRRSGTIYYRFSDREYYVYDRSKRKHVLATRVDGMKWQFHPFKRLWNPSKSSGLIGDDWDFSDWWGVYKLDGAIGYLAKYLSKTLDIGDKKSLLTMSKLWVYGMRSFSVSRRLEILLSLTKRMKKAHYYEQGKLVLMIYNRNRKRRLMWEYVGVFSSMIDLTKVTILDVKLLNSGGADIIYEYYREF